MKKYFIILLIIIICFGLIGIPTNAKSTNSKLIPNDSAGMDFFGYAVSVDKDTIVIGAWGDDDNDSGSGSAYVFARHKNGWIEEAKLTAGDGSAADHFGRSVSVDKDTIVVGAPYDDGNGLGSNSGSAYVFVRDKNSWIEEAKLTASDGAADDYFGFSVSVDNDTIVVGAYGNDDSGSSSGSAYVFVRDKNGWIEEAKLTAGDGAKNDYFGYSVSVDNDTIVIGAYGNDDDGSASGSAYVFVRDKIGWIEQAKLTASDPSTGDYFGFSVSVDNDTIVVGAPYNDNEHYDTGSAYIFMRDKNSWIEEAKLTDSDGAKGDYFGFSLSIDKDTIVVGAWGNDDEDSASGSAYVFVHDKNSWTNEANLTASDGAEGDYFGFSLSVDKDIIIVGAYGDDDEGPLSGSAYVFNYHSNK